jgi:hypothetical protein
MNVSGQKQSFNWNNKKRRLQDLISDKKITLDGEVKLKPYQAYILEE